MAPRKRRRTRERENPLRMCQSEAWPLPDHGWREGGRERGLCGTPLSKIALPSAFFPRSPEPQIPARISLRETEEQEKGRGAESGERESSAFLVVIAARGGRLAVYPLALHVNVRGGLKGKKGRTEKERVLFFLSFFFFHKTQTAPPQSSRSYPFCCFLLFSAFSQYGKKLGNSPRSAGQQKGGQKERPFSSSSSFFSIL